MEQATFSELEHDSKKRRTRREVFLEKMDRLVPWERLEKRIEPFYPKAGRGRRPYPLGTMLRVHCVQLFYNLSDPGMEDLLYEVESVRRFAGLRLAGALPDETTILKFRHLLEEHDLGEGLFAEINAHLAAMGYGVRKGTIVDASIVDAPSSTKNRKRERDPEMHQAKKGNEWRFGMKAHIGVDAETGSGAQPGDDGGERGGRVDGARGSARRRGDGVGRRGLPGRRRARGEQGPGRGLGDSDEARQAPAARRVGSGGGRREAQGVGAGEGGASVPVREAALRLREGCATGAWRRTRSGSRFCWASTNLLVAGRYATG